MHHDELLKHLHNASSLLYWDFDTIQKTSTKLTENITKYAAIHSPIYQPTPTIVEKQHLRSTQNWYIKELPNFINSTTGTSTGKKFMYRIWTEGYNIIEGKHHYLMILDEFDLKPPLKILYCVFQPRMTDNDDINIFKTDNMVISHGLKGAAEIHRVQAGPLYHADTDAFYERLLSYSVKNRIDIIIAQGSTVASLAWYATKLNFKDKICRLLSNTGSGMNFSDAELLRRTGVVENWCDHMRSWDGGATFFTCKHRTYHMHDGLAYVNSIDGKMVSTDYFSLVAPFVNYWNGDYCEISDTYQRCLCGRAYRPFKMGRTRDKTFGSTSTGITKDALMATEGSHKIKRLTGHNKHLIVHVREPLRLSESAAMQAAVPQFTIKFQVERDHVR